MFETANVAFENLCRPATMRNDVFSNSITEYMKVAGSKSSVGREKNRKPHNSLNIRQFFMKIRAFKSIFDAVYFLLAQTDRQQVFWRIYNLFKKFQKTKKLIGANNKNITILCPSIMLPTTSRLL
jgi:hypothetical protein